MTAARTGIRKTLFAAILGGASLATAFAAAAEPASLPERVSGLFDNAAQICAPITGGSADATLNAKVSTTRALLNQSATGAALLQAAENYTLGPVWICYGSQSTENKAAYFVDHGVLAVQDSADQIDTIGSTVHELRHMWQEQHGYFGTVADRSLKTTRNKVDAEFALEADAETVAVMALWEMNENGLTAPWTTYNDETLCAAGRLCYAPIGHAFAVARTLDKDAVASSSAAQAAFRQWYEDGKRLYLYRWNVIGRGMTKTPYDAHPRMALAPDVKDPYGFSIPSKIVLDKMAGLGRLPATGQDYLAPNGGIAAILARPPLVAQP